MSNEQIEKRIKELEQTVNQLAKNQTILTGTISHLSKAQNITTSNYTEVINQQRQLMETIKSLNSIIKSDRNTSK